jgi:inosine-uridine nucleoside N-ribohydrolase
MWVALLAMAVTGPGRALGQTAPAGGPLAPSVQLTILDTDIGDDIDDAFALALALQSPEIKLVGIATTYGDTALREKLIHRFLWDAHLASIPTIPGILTPQSNVFTQAGYARRNIWLPSRCLPVLSRKQEREMASERSKNQGREPAASYILELIREHPGQITLIAIGPLFNIQAAIERDPETFRELKRVVMMGGSINRGYDGRNGERRPADAEWNISRDPAGLRALLASGVPVFMMPLDSTQIHLETKEREAIFSHGSPLTDQLTLLYHQWLAGTEGHPAAPTLFDPVAVAYSVRPELCPAMPMRLEVDDKGFTRRVDGTPNAQVCLQSDEKGFLEFLLGRIAKEPAR